MSRPRIISIEGNIGSGKSTILDKIEDAYHQMGRTDVVILREPVNEWSSFKDCDISGKEKTILELFYQDSQKYSFVFQILVYLSIKNSIQKAILQHPECKIIICERSILASRNVFAKMLKNDGLMSNVEYQVYEKFVSDREGDDMPFEPDAIVYLDADPSVCLNRIGRRNRQGESNIDIEYMEKCKTFHNEWIYETNSKPFIKLNVDTEDEVKRQEWIGEVINFAENV
jgi:deoxyadenosine/deoxycytidine kinase